jgi:hypothetical protein
MKCTLKQLRALALCLMGRGWRYDRPGGARCCCEYCNERRRWKLCVK